jgi:type VI secretion system protein VasD
VNIQASHLPYETPRRWSLLAALTLTVALASGCASKEAVTRVSANFTATADVNPDTAGRASPLVTRIYVLKSPSAFASADFFSLYDMDNATLGADLVQREEVLLLPGQAKKLDFALKPDARAIGVIAAYRDLNHARWRELRLLNVGKPCSLDLRFGARQIEAVGSEADACPLLPRGGPAAQP